MAGNVGERWVVATLYWTGVVLVLGGWEWRMRHGDSAVALYFAEAGIAMVIAGRVVGTIRRRRRGR